jgi:multidrug efflux pump subunit AcrA (membrane-fusion protein)
VNRIVTQVLPAWALLLLVAVTAGCHKAEEKKEPIEVEPPVRLVKPQKRTLTRMVGQPGYVFAYEQTSLFPKVAGFIEEWLVDRGDIVKKGQLLARVYVPELQATYRQKKAQVAYDEVQIKIAEQMVEVAKEDVEVAAADVRKARADLQKYQPAVARWESEVKRQTHTKVQGRSVINPEIIAESKLQLQISQAERSAAEAALNAAQEREKSRRVDLEKARVDVEGFRAKLKVDQAEEEHVAALVSYTRVTAPYDGVIVVRNVNTGDYVEPHYGDQTAPIGGTAAESSLRGVPLYVMARNDLVRVYVDVPEMQANYVRRGSKAHVRIEALEDADIEGEVTRTSWALDYRTRTLRAEIDLPNKDARLLPGTYAYGEVEVKRPDALTVPMSAVIEIGNENTIYLYEDGKAVRMPVQTGMNDGKYVEVFRKKVKDTWEKFRGDEEVILGDLPELRDGEKVRVSHEKGEEKKESKPSVSGKERH